MTEEPHDQSPYIGDQLGRAYLVPPKRLVTTTRSESFNPALNTSSYNATRVIDPMVILSKRSDSLSLIDAGMLNSF